MALTSASPLETCLTLTQAVSRSRHLADIYVAALDALASGLGIDRSAILLFDNNQIMRFQAWRGLSAEYRIAVEGHTPWTRGQRQAQPLVVENAAFDQDLAALLPAIRAEGIAALAFVPLEGVDGVVGKFMLYSAVPRSFSREELTLARLIAAQVTFAVERHQAQTDLQAGSYAARQLAAIVESSDDAIVSKDLSGTIASWNHGAERMFGYTADEAIGRSILMIVPESRGDEELQVLSTIAQGRSVEMETVRQRKDGTLLEISLKVSPVKDGSGRIIGASKIARDITSRQRTESERTELQRRLTMLVEASAFLLATPEADSVRTTTLSLARDLLVADGYALWTLIEGQSWQIVKSEGISDRFAREVVTSYRGAPPTSLTMFQHTQAISDVSASPLLDERLDAYRNEGIRSALICPMQPHGEFSDTLVFYYRTPRVFSETDVHTAQALANMSAAALTTAALHDQQRMQRDAAESARGQAVFLAEASAILSRSLEYERTLAAVADLAVPEIADWCAIDLVGEDKKLQRLAVAHVDPRKVEFARALQDKYPGDPDSSGGVYQVIRTGKPAMLTTIPRELLLARARDSEQRRILEELALTSYMCLPLVTSHGTIGAITFVFAESGRHYLDHDLAFGQEVAIRAALAIDNAMAYRRANDANRLKDEFLATLSHELRTPLNAILGYARMLDSGRLKGEHEDKAVSVLARNAISLKQIIDDVLDVSRITSGKLRLAVRVVEVEDILKNAVATVQPAADARGVTINTVFEDDVPPISGDPDRLQQIAWNLLSNAVKFTPKGGHVELRLAGNGSLVEITVRDDGKGIEPAFLPHIFERFRQADSRMSREYGGLGLGLAIVRELVELHGGTVSALSEGPGKGATFCVALPSLSMQERRSVPAMTGVRPGDSGRAALTLPERLKGVRILAVDDEEDALALLRLVLETAGAEVTTAATGPDALELLEHASYDALVADIGMPRMDGLELIRRLRQSTQISGHRMPAAALTAYARSEDRVEALASGFQMHIPKPISPSELIVSVAALLGR